MFHEKKPWQIYFEQGFNCNVHRPYERAAKEYPVFQCFQWEILKGWIFSVYQGAFGLTLDVGFEIETQRIRDFLLKWNVDGKMVSQAEQEQMERENPFTLEIEAKVKCGRFWLDAETGFTAFWSPCWLKGEGKDSIGEHIARHYGCNVHKGWVFYRFCFPWETKRKPHWNSLEVRLHKCPGWIIGEYFTAEKVGQKVNFVYPATGQEHTLEILHITKETFDEKIFGQDDLEYPCSFMKLDYSIIPELDRKMCRLRDRNLGDSPRKKLFLPEATNDSVIGVILSADGPSRTFMGKEEELTPFSLCSVCSSLYFELPLSMEWQLMFREREIEDVFLEWQVS